MSVRNAALVQSVNPVEALFSLPLFLALLVLLPDLHVPVSILSFLLVVPEAPVLLFVDVHPCSCKSYPHTSRTSSSVFAALAVDLRAWVAPLVAMTEHVRVLPVAALTKSPRLSVP